MRELFIARFAFDRLQCKTSFDDLHIEFAIPARKRRR
ncbi:Uncharacterised protein [Vibrio cholerae]|nr:Uncharacterised protein [Vibrio cholerae]